MLTGEYGVILGGSALTIPFGIFTTRPRRMKEVPPGMAEQAAISNQSVQDLYHYLVRLPEDNFKARFNKKLFEEYSGDLWYESSIPEGYGLGSSGALAACLYNQFFEYSDSLTMEEQRHDLVLIESYFHGRSSGVDALTCFRKAPLYFREDGTITEVKLDLSDLPMKYRFFLLDSHTRFDTAPLVGYFLEQMKDEKFETRIREEYLRMNQRLIDALLGLEKTDPGLIFRVISDFQYNHFRKMIPDHMLDPWIEGQVSNEYYLKLNGSGGGYLLGICHETAIDFLTEKFDGDILWIK